MCAYVQGRVSSNGDIRLPYAVSGLRGRKDWKVFGFVEDSNFLAYRWECRKVFDVGLGRVY